MNRVEELEAFWKLEYEEFAIAEEFERLCEASNEDLQKLIITAFGSEMSLVPPELYKDMCEVFETHRWVRQINFTEEERYIIAKTLAYIVHRSEAGLFLGVNKSREQECEEENKRREDRSDVLPDTANEWWSQYINRVSVSPYLTFGDQSPHTRRHQSTPVPVVEVDFQRIETAVERVIRERRERGQQRMGFAQYIPAHQR